MSVSNGQKAEAVVFNNAFLSRTVDTSTTGKLGLANADVVSGPSITNLQRAVNLIFSVLGLSGEADSTGNDYSSEEFIDDGDAVKEALGKLDAAVKTALDTANSGGAWTKEALADNTSSYAAITGLVIDKDVYKAFRFSYTIHRTDGTTVRREYGEVFAAYGASSWSYEREFHFTDALNMTDSLRVNSSTGAAEYKSDSMGGTYSGHITWQITELIPAE